MDPELYMGARGVGGRQVYLANPRAENFDPEDTAASLAHEPRYAGNYGPYSVGQHAVLVARVVEKAGGFPPQILAGLHHDDSEMVTGDLPGPVKLALRSVTPAFDDLEEALDIAIEQRYQIDLDDPLVKWADAVVYHWEVQYVVPADARHMHSTNGGGGLVLPATWFMPWAPAETVSRYIETHNNCVRYIDSHQVPENYAANAS